MSLPWTARTARTYAIAHKRPVVTRVATGMWVMYPANREEKVFGGYKEEDIAMVEAITTLIAMDQWGVKPIIVDKLLVSERKT